MSVPKWTEERTEALENFVGDESPVSQATVADAADELETSTRSVSSKLRKLGYDVELASANATRAFSEAQEETLRAFLEDNEGEFTYAQIAEVFEDGAFSPKQIQGKVLSMELTGAVKKSQRTYTEDEEATFIEMANSGAFVEAIAEALNKPVTSVRGKALSLLREELIDAIPKQEHTKAANRQDPLTALGDLSGMTVEEIAEAIEKTPRGVRTMLTRRGLVAADYDGAARQAKAREAAAAA